MRIVHPPAIPPITEPLGRYWDAPDKSEIRLSLAFAWMTEESFKKLLTYQHTNPTGIYAGKMWKLQGWREKWMLAYCTPHENPELTTINYIRIGIEP